MNSKINIDGKIILGSANLNNTYGYNNNLLKEKEFKKIINYLRKKNFFLIDTALNYKNSQKIIFKYITQKTKLITKLPKYDETTNIHHWLKKNIEEIFCKLKVKKVYCILLHHPNDLLGPHGKIIFNEINDLKKKKFIKKIGISVYDKQIVNKIIKKYKIDIIQLPFSVFDRRFLKYNWLKKLKKNNKILIHARSIFFQGFLTDNFNSNLNVKKKMKSKILQWNSFCEKRKIKNNIAAINYVNQIKEIDNLIIGVNSFDQFKENISDTNLYKNIKFPENLQIFDEKILNLSKNKILNEK